MPGTMVVAVARVAVAAVVRLRPAVAAVDIAAVVVSDVGIAAAVVRLRPAVVAALRPRRAVARLRLLLRPIPIRQLRLPRLPRHLVPDRNVFSHGFRRLVDGGPMLGRVERRPVLCSQLEQVAAFRAGSLLEIRLFLFHHGRLCLNERAIHSA